MGAGRGSAHCSRWCRWGALAGWGPPTAHFILLRLSSAYINFEVFSFPVYSTEWSKLEKLLKQELFSPLDQVMLYSVFIGGKKNFHNPVIPLFILFTLWSIIILFNSVILTFHGLIHFSFPFLLYFLQFEVLESRVCAGEAASSLRLVNKAAFRHSLEFFTFFFFTETVQTLYCKEL